ncbi:MAG TPA: cysteine--tRNA ligase [Candidatus Sulfotelmatobacter sp.]|jgi:cysteinyl-tRNA synthetase|nr:cysteine--tRNA ligase [Candidatus Sulfotelmatobacter sp.]
MQKVMVRLYNSLTRKVEEFKPIHPLQVGMYTCGPTVYSFAHIGNFRTYTMADILNRVLQYNGYEMTYIINLTDVGHLTGDNLGDADLGEDRMEKAAQKEGKTAWEIAEFYADVFKQDFEKLNLEKPKKFAKATDHIKEQITLIKRLEEKGFTYKTSDGIYFDTANFPHYGALSNLDQRKAGARVAINPQKKNQNDFALWKFSPKGEKRHMEWKSPWGVGFPGWHIECSAMSMKYLGETFDIHTGGIDLRETHHPNEIAQAEAATGKKFVNYWVHGAFILVNGERMSKSKGNLYTVYDLEKEGYDVLALRYLYLQTHYRQEMNFTFEALDAAQNAYKKLIVDVSRWEEPSESQGKVPAGVFESFEKRFLESLNDDLNTPQALAVMWEVVKSPYPSGSKLRMLFKMDRVLGLQIQEMSFKLRNAQHIIPGHIQQLVEERQHMRKLRKFNAADMIRAKIGKLGYQVEDTKKGPKATKK